MAIIEPWDSQPKGGPVILEISSTTRLPLGPNLAQTRKNGLRVHVNSPLHINFWEISQEFISQAVGIVGSGLGSVLEGKSRAMGTGVGLYSVLNLKYTSAISIRFKLVQARRPILCLVFFSSTNIFSSLFLRKKKIITPLRPKNPTQPLYTSSGGTHFKKHYVKKEKILKLSKNMFYRKLGV